MASSTTEELSTECTASFLHSLESMVEGKTGDSRALILSMILACFTLHINYITVVLPSRLIVGKK
jgi:hypothetical protein